MRSVGHVVRRRELGDQIHDHGWVVMSSPVVGSSAIRRAGSHASASGDHHR